MVCFKTERKKKREMVKSLWLGLNGCVWHCLYREPKGQHAMKEREKEITDLPYRKSQREMMGFNI